MKLKNKTIYDKAKQLRELIHEAIRSSAYEDANLREKLLNLSLHIPLQIGLSLNLYSIENIRFNLEEAEKNLIELYIAVDLSTSEFFHIDSPKLNSLVEEIFDLIPITLQDAVEEEKKRIEEIMKEFMIDG